MRYKFESLLLAVNEASSDLSKASWESLREQFDAQNVVMEDIEGRYTEGQNWSDEDRAAYQTALDTCTNITNEQESRPQYLVQQRKLVNAPVINADIAENISSLNTRITVRDHRDIDPRFGYRTDNEYLLDVVNFFTKGQVTDGLKAVNAVGSDEYSIGDWKHGGIFVPEIFLPGTISITPEEDQLLGRMTNIPLGASTVKVRAAVDKNHSTSFTGGTVVYRTGETLTADPSRDQWENVSLEATELVGNTYVTQQLLRESAVSIPALIQNAFNLAFSYKKRDEILLGSGKGKYLGALSTENKALISVSRVAGTADSDILNGVDILKARKHVWGYENAVWVFNYDLFELVSQLHVVSDGNAGILKLYSPPQGDVPETLLGRPIVWTEFMPGIYQNDGTDIGDWGTADNTHFAACLNMTQYLHGELYRDQARSVHIRFLEREECFQFVQCDDARPHWLTSLTPKRGATTRSPFVAINRTSVAA